MYLISMTKKNTSSTTTSTGVANLLVADTTVLDSTAFLSTYALGLANIHIIPSFGLSPFGHLLEL